MSQQQGNTGTGTPPGEVQVRRRWLARAVITAALGFVVWVALSMTSEAWADAGASPAQVPTNCDHGGPYPDQDVWSFAGTKDTKLQGATFTDSGGQTRVMTDPEEAFDLSGHTIAWLKVPAGWTLTAVDPMAARVVGVCPASTSTGGEAAGVGAPGERPNADTGQGQASTGVEAPIPAFDVKPQQAQVAPKPMLPQTGQDVGSMVMVGAALVVTGVLLLFVRRRRPAPPPPRHRAGDRIWTYPS
jgi:LPXTG-motif cell wall-anchored protein